jgi:arylsulfatase A-like enzyme
MRLLGGAVAIIVLGAIGCGSSASPRYNVLLISLDTVRQDALSCYGHRPRHAPDVATTPVLDAFAAQGVRMADGYAPSSWTLPSHISLLTGVSPLVHAVETEGRTLDPGMTTMAQILGENGYRTYGVYSAPYLEPHWGFGRGFDAYEPVYAADVLAASQKAERLRNEIAKVAARHDWAAYDDLKRQEVGVDGALNDASQRAVTSDGVANAVVAKLHAFGGDARPWFVFAHFFDAHCDYVPPPPYDTRFDPDYHGSFTGADCMRGPEVGRPDPERPGGLIRTLGDRDLEHVIALYEGEVAWVDAHVGTILRALDATGQAARTLVVVVSDHGEEFFEHGGIGHRNTLYEEVVRVPILLRLPGVLPAGAVVAGPVSLSDVLPTVLEILGIRHAPFPGTSSFLPLVRGTATPADRTVLQRVAVMYGGAVSVDSGEPLVFRQIKVDEAFRTGTLKVGRTRSWPQFPTNAPPAIADMLAREAASQYARDDLRWIDLHGATADPDAAWSRDFGDAAARAALHAFHARYAEVGPQRRRPVKESVPINERQRLESLGYVSPAAGASFPEPDLALPPPPDAP